jgi:protein tyrosine/serine phosphatase
MQRSGLRFLKLAFARLAVFFICICLPAGGVYAAMLVATHNFHEVIPGELYRGAQPNAARLASYQARYGIKTVLNLRGENTVRGWYQEEAKAAHDLGINLINFRLSSHRALTKEQVNELIALMRDAPKPLLIHCMSGADRTGIATAVYLAAIAKAGEEEAEWHLSLVFGHLPFRFLGAFAMDRTFERNEPAFGYFGS